MSAPEALVALLLGLFVLHFGLTAMVRLRAVEDRLASRSDGLVSMRVARHVLRRELRHGVRGRDWMPDADSLWLRAFRGTALVCPADSAAVELIVSYSGDREPDTSKDSVLLLEPTGATTVRALVGVGSAGDPCGALPPDSLERWTLDQAAPAETVVARVFERGSYHLALSALRYRRGSGGRQPLTPEVWGDASAWIDDGARLGIAVVHDDVDRGSDWSAFLSGGGG